MSTVSAPEAPAGQPAPPTAGLEWACRLLWGHSPLVRTRRRGRPAAGFRQAESYLALPAASNPRLLVPLGARRAAGAALGRNHDATGRKARLAKAALGAGLRVGVTQRFLGERVCVDVAADLGGTAAADIVLGEHLRATFGRDDLWAAVILGPPRLNRKPVIQVLTADGTIIGYVKAAWNDLTRALVRNEAAALRRCAEKPRNSFMAPDLVSLRRFGDLELLATAALPHTTRPEGAHTFDPPLAVITEIARLTGVSQSTLGDSAYWAGIRARLEERVCLLGGEVDPLAGIVDFVERRHGDADLRFGTWHGDFTPWNMARRDGATYLWDWERCAPAPVGLDLCHFLFQSACRFEGRNPREAVEICRGRTLGLLPLLDLIPDTASALWSLYRLELLFRYDEARLRGALARPSRIHAGVLGVFETEMEA